MIRFVEARGEGRATFNLTVALNPTLVRNTPNLRAERATLPGAGPGIGPSSGTLLARAKGETHKPLDFCWETQSAETGDVKSSTPDRPRIPHGRQP